MESENLFVLLRLALDRDGSYAASLDETVVSSFDSMSESQWNSLYELVDKQTLLGVAYFGLKKLCEVFPDYQPPFDAVFQWSSEAESVRGLNGQMNKESARLTEIFEAEGLSTVILKGQANARLYPDPLSRQPGDIDIWVSGGRKVIESKLKKTNLRCNGFFQTDHHIQLEKNADGINVEVHIHPSSGNMNRLTSIPLLRYLNKNLQVRTKTPEGFYVPSMKFALAMQLSHIQRHFMGGGIGLRQLMDYAVLLQNSTARDRREISLRLEKFGLKSMAGALMWLLKKKFGFQDDLLLCKPDSWRGQWLLKDVLEGGNFGQHTVENVSKLSWIVWWFRKHWNMCRYVRFDFWETVWSEIGYWKTFLRSIPFRIKNQKVSLRFKDKK